MIFFFFLLVRFDFWAFFPTNRTFHHINLTPVTTLPKTSQDAAFQIRGLLDQFFLVWPEHKASPFWVTGESYGGNYCSNVAQTILKTNSPGKTINLVGVSVGDPVMNSYAQWPTYGSTLYGMGLINIPQRTLIDGIMAQGSVCCCFLCCFSRCFSNTLDRLGCNEYKRMQGWL